MLLAVILSCIMGTPLELNLIFEFPFYVLLSSTETMLVVLESIFHIELNLFFCGNIFFLSHNTLLANRKWLKIMLEKCELGISSSVHRHCEVRISKTKHFISLPQQLRVLQSHQETSSSSQHPIKIFLCPLCSQIQWSSLIHAKS